MLPRFQSIEDQSIWFGSTVNGAIPTIPGLIHGSEEVLLCWLLIPKYKFGSKAMGIAVEKAFMSILGVLSSCAVLGACDFCKMTCRIYEISLGVITGSPSCSNACSVAVHAWSTTGTIIL